MRTVYLAGPDVFYPEAAQRAERHKALCRLYEFEPLHPFDQPVLTSKRIFQTNVELIRRADAVIANLNPFRGPEIDSGTAFEVGFATALGKTVVGYVSLGESLRQRVERLHGPLTPGADGNSWHDREGNLVEDFGHPVNLMQAEACSIVFGDIEDALAKLCALGFVDTAIL